MSVVGLRLGWGKRLLVDRDSAVAGGGGAGGRPDTRPNGPICYAFLPSRATRYNSDVPSFPRYGTIYYGSLVRYLAAQVKTVDLEECGTGRSGRGTAVSDPILHEMKIRRLNV